ncbi:MAG: DUF4339 domain-containing protein [Opitutaceae bacterium]|nr:DUF4339 domain-containing protein [Opitutaceae bacterium]
MATQEFYVRNESETEARGPFNLEQLTSLADNGQVTAETLYYDATTEQWTAINGNAPLMTALFPEKKKLKVKGRQAVQSLTPTGSDTAPPITVDEMLAAAEGRTSDTKDRVDPGIAMARAAGIGAWACVGMFVIAAAAELLPSIDFLMAFNAVKLLEHPLVIFGIVDLVFAVLLALGTSAIYPFVRFRAALGLGFLGFIFYTQGMTVPLLAVLAGTTGLYLCTVAVSLPVVLVTAAVGLVGMAGIAWQLIMA